MTSEHAGRRQFASDNWAGMCPEALAAMVEANAGHAPSYGDDAWTSRAAEMIRELFATDCAVHFVFNGTSANSLSLAALCQPYNSILCHEHAHVEVAECSAPEFFSGGSKILLVPGANGKIDPAAIAATVKRRTDVHYPKPGAITLTQATEGGTVYTAAELREVTRAARECGLHVHMDGSRIANALVARDATPADITWRAGVDVLSFGGTKNGMGLGEAVVFFNLELAAEFEYRRKQAGQLASKMRFLTAPWVGTLPDGIWLRHAKHANDMAQRLARALANVPQAELAYPCETNGAFVNLPLPVIKALRERGWKFHTHVRPETCRLMCSWDTTEGDVDSFAAEVAELCATGCGKS